MLNNIKAIFETKYKDHIKELSKHPDTCCNKSVLKAFNFDSLYKNFCRANKVHCILKTVDLVHISESLNTLFLIEMKQSDITMSEEYYRNLVLKYIDVSEVPSKIFDSLLNVIAILGYNEVGKDFFGKYLDTYSFKIKGFILLNIPYRLLMTVQIATQDKRRQRITKRIESEIGVLCCEDLSEVFR